MFSVFVPIVMEIIFPQIKSLLYWHILFLLTGFTLTRHGNVLYMCVVIKMLMPCAVLLSKVLCAWTIAQVSLVRQAGEG